MNWPALAGRLVRFTSWLSLFFSLLCCIVNDTVTVASAQSTNQLHLPLITLYERVDWFNQATVVSCVPNAGITYADGTTRDNGEPVSGYRVVFSYEADGPIVAETLSGPHAGYPNWRAGFFSHILSVGGPRAGDWYFWIANEQGERISEIVVLHTDGIAGEQTCQQAVLKFDRH